MVLIQFNEFINFSFTLTSKVDSKVFQEQSPLLAVVYIYADPRYEGIKRRNMWEIFWSMKNTESRSCKSWEHSRERFKQHKSNAEPDTYGFVPHCGSVCIEFWNWINLKYLHQSRNSIVTQICWKWRSAGQSLKHTELHIIHAKLLFVSFCSNDVLQN